MLYEGTLSLINVRGRSSVHGWKFCHMTKVSKFIAIVLTKSTANPTQTPRVKQNIEEVTKNKRKRAPKTGV